MTPRLNKEQKEQRDVLFGTMQEGLRPIRPYRWQTGHAPASGGLIEIPVTTLPLFKIPIHVSYLIYIGTYSRTLALLYFRFALWLCRVIGIHPSLLLHPLDFLGCDDVEQLSFFPAMNMHADVKLKLVSDILRLYTDRYAVVPMHQHACELGSAKLPTRAF